MNRIRHASQDVKEPLIWESEIPSNQLEREVASINNSCKSLMAFNTTRNLPAGYPNSPFPPVASCKSIAMENCGTYAKGIGAALPAIANSSSRTMLRTTSVRGCTSALVPHIDSSEVKQTGRATGLEGAEVKSELGFWMFKGPSTMSLGQRLVEGLKVGLWSGRPATDRASGHGDISELRHKYQRRHCQHGKMDCWNPGAAP